MAKVPNKTQGVSPWIGWGISTLLLLFLNRDSGESSNTSSQQPSKFTESNVNTVGNPVPVVLGRAMVKNPIISFYGSFRADPYTEEYGMHSDLDAASLLWPFLLQILLMLIAPSEHVTQDTDTHGDTGTGTATDTQNGQKFNSLVMAILQLLIALLLNLFAEHAGRTTIQKGFLYYLGWQHIICWTGENIGIKRLWMNVYDSEVEASTETGVWDNNNHIAWESDNPNGITAYIDDVEMFGGWDEGGGFVGDVRFYFGNTSQPKDPWMIKQMTDSEGIPTELKGLTPKYPMYLTCVISNKDKETGAYIGKQATVPEMWFEVVNYPHRLRDVSAGYRQEKFDNRIIKEYQKIIDFMSLQAMPVQNYMQGYIDVITNVGVNYLNTHNQNLLTDLSNAIIDAYNNYPNSDKSAFYESAYPLYNIVNHGVWTLGELGEDLNPAEAIYDILRNEYWGCNYTEDRVDINSLIDLGCTCEEESLGVSCLINRVAQANEYVTKILSHINGVKYDNPMTGKLTFKLIRNDYDIDELKVFDTSNCESCEFSRLDWSETTSSISLSFTDASNKYDTGQFSQTDIANRLITGAYTEKSVDGEYFTTVSNARWLAQTSLLSAGYPLSAINLVTNRIAYDITVGDPIKVNWEPYGITQMVFRVTDIDYATLTDGRISITAIEDVFGFDKLDFDFSSTPAWTDPEKEPYDVARYMFMELPYETTMNLNTYVHAFAAQPSSYTIYWDIWRYSKGTYSLSAKSSTWSMVGRMVYGYNESYDFDATGFELAYVGVNSEQALDDKIIKINNAPYTYNHNSNLNILVVDNEIMSYDTITKLPNGHYQIAGVVRGIFDTIPKKHTAESIVYFGDYSLNVNGNGFVALAGDISHEQLEIKTETQDKAQEFDITDIEHFTTTRRSEQPSIMANLKFGADKGTETSYNYNYPSTQIFSGDVLFNFIGRNKFNSYGILEQTDDITDVNVSEDTKNVINVSCNGEEYEYKYDAWDSDNEENVTEMRMSWADFCKEIGEKVSVINTVSVTVKTYDSNKGLYSYDEYNKTLNYTIPRLAGVVTDESLVQDYADTLVQPNLNNIILPATDVSPQITLTYEDCALIFIGSLTDDPSDIKAQDGKYYLLSTEAYRIDGCDDNGNAILHKVEIEEEFIFRTNYTTLISNYSEYYRYRLGNYISYIPYE